MWLLLSGDARSLENRRVMWARQVLLLGEALHDPRRMPRAEIAVKLSKAAHGPWLGLKTRKKLPVCGCSTQLSTGRGGHKDLLGEGVESLARRHPIDVEAGRRSC